MPQPCLTEKGVEIMRPLKEVLEENKQAYIQRLMDLIAIDTHDLGHGIAGGLEKQGQEYMVKLFEDMGADSIRRDPMTEEAIKECLAKYQEGNIGHNYDDRYNVYAVFKGDKDGRRLMLNGHIDTMTAGNDNVWNTPPHTPTMKDCRLYGLGAADMKGGLMASVMAVQLLKDAGIKLPGDVHITSVCDEEGGGNGSMAAIMSGEKADGVVVCEPSSDELILAHMGFVFFKVEFEGKANHSGAKWKGVSAIDKAFKVIRELEELEHKWLLTYKHPLLPAPNLNIGTIHGGSAGSTVPGHCYFETCIHYLPRQMSYDQIVEEFTDAVNRVADSDLWLCRHRPVITMYQAGGAFEQESDDSFVACFMDGYEKALGRQVRLVGSPAGCDSRLWKNIAGCPTMQFGPGRLEECHAVNEYVEAESYLEAILVYAQLILEWCKANK